VTRRRALAARTSTSTTRITLRRLRIGLLVGAGVTLVATFGAFEGANLTIGTASARGMPAVLYTLNARQAAVSANQAAAQNFALGRATQLAGAGPEYEAQVNLATQSLEQIAAVNQAGTKGSQLIASGDGQLASYGELIQQADANYASGEATTGAAEAWHAAQSMQGPGMLADLQQLLSAEQSALPRPRLWFWTDGWAVALWLTPVLALLTALVLAQVYLARRFRRAVSWPLAAATLLLVALAAGSHLLVHADQQFDAARQELRVVVRDSETATRETNDEGQRAVSALLPAPCGSAAGCGPTIAVLRSGLPGAPTAEAIAATENAARSDTRAAKGDLAAAGARHGLLPTIPAVAVAVAVLVLLGLQPRINEYRYQT
jgi:hypothetical protein